MSFTVGDGEIFGLLGPNGAGKTTTVRMLAGLISPTAGTAIVNGHPLGETTQQIRAFTGILTESPGLHEKLTARQNLAYYGRLYGLRGARLREAVDRYLGVVEMSEYADRRVGGFSKGMRQKIAIARALLHEPEVIYLDEPTSGLDPSAAKTVRDFIATLRALGRSIVVCTHNLDEAERLCDRIGIMRGTPAAGGHPCGPSAPRTCGDGPRRAERRTRSRIVHRAAGRPFVRQRRAGEGEHAGGRAGRSAARDARPGRRAGGCRRTDHVGGRGRADP